MKWLLQGLHSWLRPLAWYDLCPTALLRLWCYLGDIAYRGRVGDRFS